MSTSATTNVSARRRQDTRGQVPVSTCDRFWSVREVADFLGVPAATIYQWRHRGDCPPAMRIGKYLRFDPDAVRAWASAHVR